MWSNPCLQLTKKVTGLVATEIAIPRSVFNFSGQTGLDTFSIEVEERVVLIGFLVQQLLDLTFRETEGMLAMMQEYYSIETVPDHSTLCRKIQSHRFAVVLDRFFQHIVSDLPTRKAVVSTDATGYSGRKRGWRDTSHADRAAQDWVKANVIVEVDEFIVLAFHLFDSDLHESQTFEDV